MSHFSVAVLTDKLENLKEMLSQYDENLKVEPYVYKKKEEIINEARERRERFLKREKNGEELSDWALKYINANNDEELYKAEIDDDTEYDDDGNELSTYNPNSKWDWYEIGGRWHNNLLVKADDNDIEKGNASWGNLESNKKEAPKGYKWVDGARIKNIDFEKYIEFTNKYNNAIRFWELYVEGQEPKNEEEKEMIKWEMYKKEYYIERYESKENYAKRRSTFTTWALLDETGWHEQGKMGWFRYGRRY